MHEGIQVIWEPGQPRLQTAWQNFTQGPLACAICADARAELVTVCNIEDMCGYLVRLHSCSGFAHTTVRLHDTPCRTRQEESHGCCTDSRKQQRHIQLQRRTFAHTELQRKTFREFWGEPGRWNWRQKAGLNPDICFSQASFRDVCVSPFLPCIYTCPVPCHPSMHVPTTKSGSRARVLYSLCHRDSLQGERLAGLSLAVPQCVLPMAVSPRGIR